MKMIFMIVNKQKLVLDIFLNLLERISTLFQNKVIFLSLNKRTPILLQSLFFIEYFSPILNYIITL
jgi:hypothetical protein